MTTINIIGTGNMGGSLAIALNKKLTLQHLLNRTVKKAETLSHQLNAGIVVEAVTQLQPANYHALTVSDDQLLLVANQLAEQQLIRSGDIVFHCCGALTAHEILAPLEKQGALIASCHPPYSISNQRLSLEAIPFVLEGNEQACSRLKTVFESIGATCMAINREDKLIYHTGLVIASNYTVALLASSIQLLRTKTNLNNEAITVILKTLVQNNIDTALQAADPITALTGPAMRGDLALIQAEEKALADRDPSLSQLYRILADFIVNRYLDSKKPE